MARLSRYLKLKIDDVRLTGDSVRNLELLDSLGANVHYRQEVLTLRSARDIVLEPNSEDLGGLGEGGAVSIGSATFPVSTFTVHADSLDLAGVTSFDLSTISLLGSSSGRLSLSAPASFTDYSLVFPSDNGSLGQVLTTDGNGNLSFTDPAGGKQGSFSWTQADGTEKSIAHGFGSTAIEVYVHSPSENKQILLESIRYDNINTLTLFSVDNPPASGYNVYLREVT